jgi:hypothetical protein
MAEFTIPEGYAVPLVDLDTYQFPDPTTKTYVSVRNHDGSAVTGPKFVVLTLSADGNDVDDIAVYDSLEDVG